MINPFFVAVNNKYHCFFPDPNFIKAINPIYFESRLPVLGAPLNIDSTISPPPVLIFSESSSNQQSGTSSAVNPVPVSNITQPQMLECEL
jgi:hypothetical protein